VMFQSPRCNEKGDREDKLLSVKSKGPFILTDFDHTCHGCTAPVHGVLYHAATMRGEIGKTVSTSRVKCPSLLTDFGHNCTDCITWAGSAWCAISVTPLQYEARYGGKTVSDSGLMCPSLLTDFDQIGYS
jgi:hypothetical protein